jgi:hypothetical protein
MDSFGIRSTILIFCPTMLIFPKLGLAVVDEVVASSSVSLSSSSDSSFSSSSLLFFPFYLYLDFTKANRVNKIKVLKMKPTNLTIKSFEL